MAYKLNASKMLDELLKATSNCFDCFSKSEVWSDLEVNEVKNELEKASKKANMNGSKTYVIEDQSEHEILNELALKYIGSMIYDNLIDLDSRDGNTVDMGYPLKYLDEMVRYMANEFDIWKLNGVEFVDFCRELMEMRIPFRMDIINRLCNGFNEYGIGWKNRCLVVNGNEYKMMFDCMKLRLSELKYNEETDRIECMVDSKYESIIQSFSNYLQDKSKGDELRSAIDRKLLNSFLDEYPLDMNNEDVQDFFYPIYSPLLKESVISEGQYDDKLREWIGDYKWKLLYRASENYYSGLSFHEYCDDKGPTLIVIKSSGGWIFGGYTTQSWKYTDYTYKHEYHHDYFFDRYKHSNKNDSKAFIFTLKNPHGVVPTRYMKREESKYAIYCWNDHGPVFGDGWGFDIRIKGNFYKKSSCSIENDGTNGYECHPEYKSSLFVDTAGPDKKNMFTVLDYEVFGIDFENRENISKLCKHPDIIWEYIETKDISEESLKQFDDAIELLNDLDVIHCDDSNIRLKISNYYLKNPSEFLPDTQIINQQYDDKLREWVGDYKWRLLYRASEHGYTGESFHEYCNYERPTLIVIKSSGGWIFGGYTTQSWSGDGIYYDMIDNNHRVQER